MRRTPTDLLLGVLLTGFLLAALVLCALLVARSTAHAQPVPCGYVGDPPVPWYVQDGAGNPRPCPPDPGAAPTPIPATPAPTPDYPARSILVPINP